MEVESAAVAVVVIAGVVPDRDPSTPGAGKLRVVDHEDVADLVAIGAATEKPRVWQYPAAGVSIFITGCPYID